MAQSTGMAAALLLALAACGRSADRDRSWQFSAERGARIDQAIQQYVDDGIIAGAVTLVLQHGRVVQHGAYGWADKPGGRRMTPDAMFRIASQTKAVTSVAVMMLIEEGRLSLADPVSKYLPTFAQTTVALPGVKGVTLAPANRPITIRHLLTHTAGISYGTDPAIAPQYRAAGLGPAAGYGWYTADKDEPICETMDRLGTLPFVSQPGAAFVYGYSTDVLGCVVERIAEMSLDQFFRTRIFEPLGMDDTYFFLPPEKAARLTAVHQIDSAGGLGLAPEGARGQGHYLVGPRKSYSGGAGLVSTAGDYGRFLQMLLGGGILEGQRLLSPAAVRLMTANMVGPLFSGDGLGYSLAFQTVERTGGGGSPATAGSFGWGGAYQSDYSVDPAEDLVAVVLTQHLPNVRIDLGRRFLSLVYRALVPSDPR